MKTTTRFSLSNLLRAAMPLAALVPGGHAAQTNLGKYEDLCLDTESLPYMGIDEDFEVLTIPHMGEPRSVFVHVPNATGQPLPMVMDLHGMGGCPSFQMTMTGWLGLSDANNYVYVAPLGRTDPSISVASCWSLPGGREITLEEFEETTLTPPCCCTTENNYKTWTDYETLQDDVFLRNVIKYLTTTDGALDVTIDPSKVVVTGHSNGGMAAFALAARHSDVISGIAVFGGSALTPFADDYSPIPVVIVHGQKDGEAPYDGLPTPYGYGFDSTENVFSMVADKNGCDAEIVNESLAAEDGFVRKRTNCTNDADVTLVVLEKGGHNPYKGADRMWNDGWGVKKTVVDTTKMACMALFGDDCANDVPESESGAFSRSTGVVCAFALLLSLLWL